jgi:hypothetical protein
MYPHRAQMLWKGFAMNKLLTAAAAAILLATPALAQSSRPAADSELKQDQVRPGVLGPGVTAVTPSGDVIPGGDAEAKQTGPDGNVSKTLPMSGAAGAQNPAIGTGQHPAATQPNANNR